MSLFFPPLPIFTGLDVGEEISIEIEEGKTLFIKLLNVGEPDEKGIRSLTFELNGKARTTMVEDKSVKGDAKAREKADPSGKRQACGRSHTCNDQQYCNQCRQTREKRRQNCGSGSHEDANYALRFCRWYCG